MITEEYMRTTRRRSLGAGAVTCWGLAIVGTILIAGHAAMRRFGVTVVPLVGGAILLTFMWWLAPYLPPEPPTAEGAGPESDKREARDRIADAFVDATEHIKAALPVNGKPAAPSADTPCPKAIIDACQAADEVGEAQRVALKEYGWIGEIRPGTDPEAAWGDIRECLLGGANGTRRLHRASGAERP